MQQEVIKQHHVIQEEGINGFLDTKTFDSDPYTPSS